MNTTKCFRMNNKCIFSLDNIPYCRRSENLKLNLSLALCSLTKKLMFIKYTYILINEYLHNSRSD